VLVDNAVILGLHERIKALQHNLSVMQREAQYQVMDPCNRPSSSKGCCIPLHAASTSAQQGCDLAAERKHNWNHYKEPSACSAQLILSAHTVDGVHRLQQGCLYLSIHHIGALNGAGHGCMPMSLQVLRETQALKELLAASDSQVAALRTEAGELTAQLEHCKHKAVADQEQVSMVEDIREPCTAAQLGTVAVLPGLVSGFMSSYRSPFVGVDGRSVRAKGFMPVPFANAPWASVSLCWGKGSGQCCLGLVFSDPEGA